MRLLIMGPPGAGKGTQAGRISDRYDIPALSTGDAFRASVAAGTPLGAEVERYLLAGEHVPDEIADAIVREQLAGPGLAGGFVLDGYPRTLHQGAQLDTMLAELDVTLDAVVVLTVSTDELVQRLLRRAREQRRADDIEAAIRRRHVFYLEHTVPLVQAYGVRQLLAEVDGTGGIDEVADRIHSALGHVHR